jgi:hypothetical protein
MAVPGPSRGEGGEHMKFESPFGIGEIVTTHQLRSGDRIRHDLIGEVLGITFLKDGQQSIHVRTSDGHMMQFLPSELIGDPDFDQESGKYAAPA